MFLPSTTTTSPSVKTSRAGVIVISGPIVRPRHVPEVAASALAEVGARANVRLGPMETASCVGVGGVVQNCLRYLWPDHGRESPMGLVACGVTHLIAPYDSQRWSKMSSQQL